MMWQGAFAKRSSSMKSTMMQLRSFKLDHYSKELSSKASKESIPLCDYLILQRTMNHNTQYQTSYSNLTSLNQFIRNIKSSYNPPKKIIPLKFTNKSSKIQSLFCLILHSLHYSCIQVSSLSSQQLHLMSNIPKELSHTLNNKNVNNLFKKQISISSFERKLRQLYSLYKYGDSSLKVLNGDKKANYVETIHNKNLKITLLAFLVHNKDYGYDDLIKWISCITSKSITEACKSLSGLYSFPDFITKDVLSRIPTSEYEVNLLIDLLEIKHGNTDHSYMSSIKNIIHHLKIYDYTKIPSFVENIISSYSFKSAELNDLLKALSETPQVKNTEDYYLKILDSQRLVYNSMNESKYEISVLGCLGLANVLIHIIPARAEALYNSIIERVETPQEIQLVNILKLTSSESPESLINNIDNIIEQKQCSLKVWDSFISKAQEYSLLTSKNSQDLYKRYEFQPFTHHSKSFFIENISDVQEVFQLVKNSKLDNRSICLILTKLYRYPESIGCFKSGPDFARYIFQNLETPTRAVIGRVLVGESYIDPINSYELYQKFMKKYLNFEPNEKCLLSLIIPALKYNQVNLKWNEKYPSQIAVHEFRKYVKSSLSDDKTLIPSSETWCSYLLLCGRCNYQEEISEVMQIWQNLKFIPSRKALSILLGGMPSAMSETIRNHGYQNLLIKAEDDSNDEYIAYDLSKWPWPTKHEVDYWHSKMIEAY